MWTDDETNLAPYTNAIAGQPYQDFAAQLKAAQGGAWVQDPTVLLDNFVAAPSQTSHSVTIQIFWKSTGGDVHSYVTSGVIGQN
jgi:hypothetical protein